MFLKKGRNESLKGKKSEEERSLERGPLHAPGSHSTRKRGFIT